MCLNLGILALIYYLSNIWRFTYIYISVCYFTLKTLDGANKYWPGCRQLAWFPRHRVLPTHSWTTVTIRLPSTGPHIHLKADQQSKLTHFIPWIRSQKDALLLSIALSKPHLRTIANIFFWLGSLAYLLQRRFETLGTLFSHKSNPTTWTILGGNVVFDKEFLVNQRLAVFTY